MERTKTTLIIDMEKLHNTQFRFSDRVEDYVAYRPGYPSDAIDFICNEVKLSDNAVVADVGAGTGISAIYFADRGYKVYGIEPDEAMRRASKAYIKSNFLPLYGTDVAIPLPEHSVDMVITAQAFHWFDITDFRKECIRILQPEGKLCIMWNDRDESDALQKEYTQIIDKYNVDYYKVHHHRISDDIIEEFFFPSECIKKSFAYEQKFDEEGLIGRLASCSYMPSRTDSNFPDVINAAKELFNKFQCEGFITFAYHTRIYIGKLNSRI